MQKALTVILFSIGNQLHHSFVWTSLTFTTVSDKCIIMWDYVRFQGLFGVMDSIFQVGNTFPKVSLVSVLIIDFARTLIRSLQWNRCSHSTVILPFLWRSFLVLRNMTGCEVQKVAARNLPCTELNPLPEMVTGVWPMQGGRCEQPFRRGCTNRGQQSCREIWRKYMGDELFTCKLLVCIVRRMSCNCVTSHAY